jgi:hypothetical protein
MRWTTLWQERGQEVLEFTNTFHTLHTKLGIKDSEIHLVLKYRGDVGPWLWKKTNITKEKVKHELRERKVD